MVIKLDEEKKKFEQLLDEKLELDEKMKLTNKSFEETKAKNEQTTEVIRGLKDNIDAQTKVTEDLSQRVEEAKKTNKIEEEKFRKLAQMNAALKAKLEFIQTKYDFTTNVNHLNSDDFKTLMTTNELVSLKTIDIN